MEESKNTPPHAEFHIVVEKDIKVDAAGIASNCKIDMSGCSTCLKDAFVFLLLEKPAYKQFFNEVIRMANERRAQKEN